MRSAAFWLRAAAGGLAIVLVAGAIVFVGGQMAESEPVETPVPTRSPPPEYTSSPPDPGSVVLPTATPLSPADSAAAASVTIKGTVVPLAPGMEHTFIGYAPPGPPGTFEQVEYRELVDGQFRFSWVTYNDQGIESLYIFPEHQAYFQPVLDALK